MSTSTAHGVIRASSALWMLILVIGVFVQLSTELPMFYYAHTTEMRVFAFLSATVGLLLRPKDNPRLVIFYVICNAITFASMWTGAVEVFIFTFPPFFFGSLLFLPCLRSAIFFCLSV